MTFDCDDIVRICDKITNKCGMTCVEQILRTTDDNYIPLINWIKSPCRGRGLSYGFYNNATKNNRAEWIHNKTYNVVMNYSFNTLVDLDIDKDGIYYYENLEVDINNDWKKKLIILKFCFILNFIIDKTISIYYNMRTFLYQSKDLVSSCSHLCEYTFKPFSFFKTEDQLVAFAAAKYKSLNNKYMALLNELNDKTAKTWKNLIIKKKQKKAKAKIRKLQEDFK